jgi:hypothetical protein
LGTDVPFRERIGGPRTHEIRRRAALNSLGSTLSQLRDLRLTGMAAALEEQSQSQS